MDVDKSGDGESKETRETRDAHPPMKKYKMSETMKGLIWNLVCLSNECCRIENEKKYVTLPQMGFADEFIFIVALWKGQHRK
jgi:Ubinuclein conserved middle domain